MMLKVLTSGYGIASKCPICFARLICTQVMLHVNYIFWDGNLLTGRLLKNLPGNEPTPVIQKGKTVIFELAVPWQKKS